MELYELTARKLAAMIRAGEVSSEDAVRSVLGRIDEVEPAIHAYITVTPEMAIAQIGRAACRERV